MDQDQVELVIFLALLLSEGQVTEKKREQLIKQARRLAKKFDEWLWEKQSFAIAVKNTNLVREGDFILLQI